ncbi:hypothetical protein [Vibrio comitans]|uniref:Lipoprotein n=1 Tax=Vibrio comitans NBRC 102076 TaxID=1219078 RepID=A0A4Y3IMR1_9VIBR|nr:hypothetical protein [Vibrio comitans]GEA60178.1 hypothetical protein VCO01S_13710 [Vibrio comitans NBRC 102076]
MNKKTVVLAILSIISTGALASNAVLNVEGQIQINGSTVIGSDGKVVSSALPASSGVTVDLDKYYPKPGIYKFQYDDTYSDEVCTDTDNYISDMKTVFSSECVDVNNNPTYSGGYTWTNNGDGTETIISRNNFNGQEIIETTTNDLEVLADYDSIISLGSATGYLERTTVISTDSEWNQVGNISTYARAKSVLGFITSVKVANTTYNDCILMQNIRPWSGTAEFDIYCSDVGLVLKTSGSSEGYHLVSYTHSGSSVAYSVNASSHKSVDKNIADKARAKLAQSRTVN